MIYFLVHGKNEKYQKGFTTFIRALNQHEAYEKAWLENLGDATEFERRWKRYWRELPENVTADLRNKATVATLTSIVARLVAQNQTINDFSALNGMLVKGLTLDDQHWLPESLVKQASNDVSDML